jgi:steroid delta-isomerase-like uncharacterized protein
MSTEENKALLRRYTEEVWNNRNTSLVEEFVAQDFVDHHLSPELGGGPAAIKAEMNQITGAFPDFHVTIEDLIAEGDKVVARATNRGTHQGEFQGIPATGKRVCVSAIAIARIADGKLAEWWENADVLGLMQQIGAIPAPGEGS